MSSIWTKTVLNTMHCMQPYILILVQRTSQL